MFFTITSYNSEDNTSVRSILLEHLHQKFNDTYTLQQMKRKYNVSLLECIHGYSDTRGTYGYEYMYSTCNTTVTIVYMDTLTQGVHMVMSTCTVHVIPLLL